MTLAINIDIPAAFNLLQDIIRCGGYKRHGRRTNMKSTKHQLHKLGYCRKCLNNKYGMNIQRKDSYIFQYPMRCNCCGKSKNIICKVRFPYNIILWFKMNRKR